jgi:anti-anti-sigma regulatory factor
VPAESDNDKWLRQDDFSIAVSRDGEGSVTVALAGEFDRPAAVELRERLMRFDVLHAGRVYVNCARVTCEASGIQLLVGECKRARSARAALPTKHGDDAPRVLQVSGLVGVHSESPAVPQR